jgi:diguanylate cyclase (GGDEF)-like protein
MRWGHKSRNTHATGAGSRDRDEVTGLAPYAVFVHECADAMSFRPGAAQASPAVLLVDLEGIAEASETDGHAAGAELLRLVATRVSREVGSLGLLARISDHQLGVLFPDLAAPAVALDLAYRIVAAVSSPTVLASQRRVQVSASCGLVTRDTLDSRATAADMVRAAGLAVREARRTGRNRIEVCNAELIADADETIAIGRDLRQALLDNGLRVYYQPVVELASGRALGFEALVRWSHPVHGVVAPSRFVAMAEELGLISELGRMVLSTATAQVQHWSTTYGVPLNAHVNVSGIDLAQDGFVAMVQECLAASSLPATQLVLEVTEATVEPELEIVRSRFEALQALGVRVALDDFGTGGLALSCLQSLSVDIIKVDRSYLDDGRPEAVDERRADELLNGMIGLGRALGIQAYGEGIEDESQRSRLMRNGCEVGQGYLFARPLPSDEAGALLREQLEPMSSLSRRILAAGAHSTPA